jgi:hypothetical protein
VAAFNLTARTKYIGQRESTLLVDLDICAELVIGARLNRAILHGAISLPNDHP